MSSDGFTREMIDDFKRRVHEGGICNPPDCPICQKEGAE